MRLFVNIYIGEIDLPVDFKYNIDRKSIERIYLCTKKQIINNITKHTIPISPLTIECFLEMQKI